MQCNRLVDLGGLNVLQAEEQAFERIVYEGYFFPKDVVPSECLSELGDEGELDSYTGLIAPNDLARAIPKA